MMTANFHTMPPATAAMPAAPAISIAIVSFGDGATLAGALGALPGQTFTDFEVLVIDNGTEPGPLHAAMAACPGCVRMPRAS